MATSDAHPWKFALAHKRLSWRGMCALMIALIGFLPRTHAQQTLPVPSSSSSPQALARYPLPSPSGIPMSSPVSPTESHNGPHFPSLSPGIQGHAPMTNTHRDPLRDRQLNTADLPRETNGTPKGQGVGHLAADRALKGIAASMRKPIAPGSKSSSGIALPFALPSAAREWPLGTSPFDAQSSQSPPLGMEQISPTNQVRPLQDLTNDNKTSSDFVSFRSVLKQKDYRLADQPQLGEHYYEMFPQVDCRGVYAPYCDLDFLADPVNDWLPYDSASQIDVYSGKTLNANQRPLLELGRPYYFLGQFPESYTFLGETNLVAPRFVIFGDYRTALATNDQNGNTQTVWAHRLNLDMDLKLTATERFHVFMGPLDHGNQFTRGVFDNGQYDFFPAFDGQLDTAFFEGDLGALAGGLGNEVLPFDLPIAIGLMPLIFQNGIWMEDAILGAAATIPAQHSSFLDLSNFDITFFAGIDKLVSPAFAGDDGAAKVYGTTTFIEAYDGYFEAGYAYLEDRSLQNRSYHNIGLSYTRRYRSIVSTSYRAIVNSGQTPNGIDETAEGVLLLWENSLITSSPYTCVPYFNLFVGFGRPQSVARAGVAGGILRNTGINFETDGLTGYPTLDASGNDTFGGAIGMNLLSSNFDQQLVAEFAFLNTMGSNPNRNAPGDQYGFGLRYQLPVTNAVILRCDAMVGLLNNANDISGVRFEFRHKF